jgi:hypothetical protein
MRRDMHKRHNTFLFLLAALVALLAVTGCGSDESTEASLTKAQFVKKADLICEKAAGTQFEQISVYLKHHSGPVAVEELTRAEEQDVADHVVIPPLQRALQELEDLSVPAGYEDRVEGFIEAYGEALEAVEAEPLLAMSQQNTPFAKANGLAAKYEFGDCSQNP